MRLRQLAQYCEYGDEIEKNIRDQIILSCISSKLRKRLLTKLELTLNKLAQTAQAMKDASHYTKQIEEKNQLSTQIIESMNKLTIPKPPQHPKPLHHQLRFPREQNFQQNTNQQTRLPPKGCYRCGATGHYAEVCRRSKHVTCQNCGKLGHFTNMCRTRKSNSNKQQYQQHNNRANNYQKNKQHVNAATIQKQEESSGDDVYVFQIGNKSSTHPVIINNTKIDIIIDSGSTINILDEQSFNLIIPQPKIEHSKTKIHPYQSDSPLKLHGVAPLTIKANQTSLSTKFYIVKGNYGSLLGKETAEALDLLRVGPPKFTAAINVPSDNTPPSTQNIIDKYDTVFHGTGTLKNFELQLHIDPTVVPVQQPIQRVPYHTKEKLSAEIERLTKLDIIEKVDGPTTWLNPVVLAPKPSGKHRLCLDMRQANKAIIRERYVIPKLEDILTEIHGAKYFSKINLTEGYHQIKLAENSRHITPFATHEGLHRYKRLIYGISSAF